MKGGHWSLSKTLRSGHFGHGVVEILSVVFVGVGVLLWFRPLQILREQAGSVVRTGVLVELLLYVFFAVGFTIVGLAFYVYSLHSYNAREDAQAMEPNLTQLDVFLEPPNQAGPAKTLLTPDTKSINEADPRRFARTYLLAFVEAAVVFAFYGVLVFVYDANPPLRAWMNVNAPWAGYLLNDTVLLLLLGIFLGFLLSELRAIRRKKWKLILRMWRTLR